MRPYESLRRWIGTSVGPLGGALLCKVDLPKAMEFTFCPEGVSHHETGAVCANLCIFMIVLF